MSRCVDFIEGDTKGLLINNQIPSGVWSVYPALETMNGGSCICI